MHGRTSETGRRRESPPSHQRRVKASLFHLLLAVAAVAGLAFVAAKPAHAQTAPFSSRFTTDAAGDIAIVGNTLMSCPATETNCQAARNGTGSATYWNNDAWDMEFVDVDNVDPRTFNSSTAQFDLPDGGAVLWAGLYWGARKETTAPGYTERNQVLFTTEFGEEPYTQITGQIIGTSTAGTGRGVQYHAFAEVTELVQARGSGTYAVANVQATQGRAEEAGWSLVVVYRDPGAPQRNLTVFDGFNNVSDGNTVDIPISGFHAPPDGPVRASLGVVAYEGDLGLTGDDLQFRGGNQQNFTYVTNDLNPRNNFFNSSITRDGVRVAAPQKNPDYVNQLGFDIDVVDASNIIPPGAMSATLRLTTNQDAYFPGVVTTAIELYAPDVNLNKTVDLVEDLNGDGDADPGDILEYRVTATNTGQDRAEDFVLTDDIPDNTAYVDGSLVEVQGANPGGKTDPADGDTAEFDAAQNQVVFRLGQGATGAPTPSGGTLGIPPPSPGNPSEIAFRVEVLASAIGTTIENQAGADFYGPGLDQEFNQESNVVQTPVRPSADLAIEKVDDPDTVRVGERITYTLTVTNNGPSPAQDVTVSDVLPNAVSFVSATPGPPDCTGPPEPRGGTVECDLGDLAPNDTRTIEIVVEAAEALGEVINTATVESSTEDPDPDNNRDVEETTILPSADLAIEKVDDPDTVRVGERITYTLTVTNNGPSPAEGVTVSDVLPNAVRFVSATPSQGDCTGPGPGLGGTVTCALGGLAPNDTATIEIVVEAAEALGEVINTATVESPTDDPDPDNNQADEETTIRPTPPCADLTVKVKSPDRVKVGQRFPYTVTVRNLGPAEVSNAVLTSRLPRSVKFVRASAGCRYDRAARKVTCDLGDMTVGSVKQRKIVVKAQKAGTVRLQGCAVKSGTPDCVPSNNTLGSAGGARSAGGEQSQPVSGVGPETTVIAGPDGSSPRQGSSREEE